MRRELAEEVFRVVDERAIEVPGVSREPRRLLGDNRITEIRALPPAAPVALEMQIFTLQNGLLSSVCPDGHKWTLTIVPKGRERAANRYQAFPYATSRCFSRGSV